MTDTDRYDVVVIGGTLAATVAAALLSERRYHGLLIDQGELASVNAALLPDLVLMDEASPVMQFVHKQLHVGDRLQRTLRQVTPALQAIFPDARVDVPADRADLVAELRRAFGDAFASTASDLLNRIDGLEAESVAYLEASGTLPASGYFARRAAGSLAKRHADVTSNLRAQQLLDAAPEDLVYLLLSVLPFMTHLDARTADDTSVTRFVRPLARVLRGLARFEDGRSVRALFEDHARRGGFTIVRDRVAELKPQGKELHVSLVDSGRTFHAACAIDASSDLSGLDTIPVKWRKKDLASTLEAARPRGYLHTLVLEVDRRVVPPGLGPNVLLLNGRREHRSADVDKPRDRPILLLRRDVPDTPDRVRLIALHPMRSVERDASGFVDTAIRARIERLIPFVDEGHVRVATAAAHGACDVPILAHPLFDAELDPLAGIAGVPSTTSLKNVFVAGPAVLPGLGAEGQYHCALQAVDEIDHVIRSKKRPKTLALRMQ